MKLCEIREEVEKKLNVKEFSGDAKERAKALSLIIAEVLYVDDEADVNISGIPFKAEWVKEVYRMIEHDDLKAVLDHYDQVRRSIKNPKSYLRTALYNAVNERSLRETVERQGTFDPEEAFNIALKRTYGNES